MFCMIDSLEQFIKLDCLIYLDECLQCVECFCDFMVNFNVIVLEQFCQVLEVYLVEVEYGIKINFY